MNNKRKDLEKEIIFVMKNLKTFSLQRQEYYLKKFKIAMKLEKQIRMELIYKPQSYIDNYMDRLMLSVFLKVFQEHRHLKNLDEMRKFSLTNNISIMTKSTFLKLREFSERFSLNKYIALGENFIVVENKIKTLAMQENQKEQIK